jgi:exopolyphosphatase/guanosine-5'-triphosphate,3'-diphosphate pyrophosphatase
LAAKGNMSRSSDVGAQSASAIPDKLGPNSSAHDSLGGGRRAVLGALDLGTNNCRLLVATPKANGFRVIDAFSRIVRLGEGLATRGVLGEAAIERTIDALKICARKLGRRQATRMRSVATEACRLANNRSEFVDRVREETGIALDIISPAEESRLAVLGCRALFNRGAQYFLVFDIGGGSTEMTCVERMPGNDLRILDWLSLPIGVVRLSEEAETGHRASETFNDAARLIRTELQKFRSGLGLPGQMDPSQFQLIGSSGTVTTLASVALGLEEYDRSKVDGSSIESGKMRKLTREIAILSDEERGAIPCIGPDRADLLVPGCAVLATILEAWPIDRITIADRGIREGILRSLISDGRNGQVFTGPAAGSRKVSVVPKETVQ